MASPYTKSPPPLPPPPPPPPPAPADAEVLRNIEVLAAFVAKTGAQFEQLARTNTAGDPKFGFLLGGSAPGSEAERAHEFYQWKKQRLEQRVFASDGSDDLQLKICAMVDDGFTPLKPLLPSDTHAMDNVKTLPPGGAERKKSEASAGGVQNAETSQSEDSVRKPGRPPHHRSRDDMKPPRSTALQKKPDAISSDRIGKNASPSEDSIGRPHPPLQEAATGVTDSTKKLLSTSENKKATLNVVGASQGDPSRRASHPVQRAKDAMPPLLSEDPQKKNPVVDEGAHKAGISKDDSRNSPGCPSDGAKAPEDVGMDQQAAEAAEKHSKEAYGLRLLKSALADYVKEVLKPAWKEGNMSKDAFKAIVKKVVDKVTGSLQAHQIPKSQENVDQYMAQSQAKISKLVQGYVDKFKKN